MQTGRKAPEPAPSTPPPAPRWLLLIHHLPPKPDYFRVKVRRRLHRLGAVALKNSVYVLPHSESAVEDFTWLLREILDSGGDALLSESVFMAGVSDADVVALFRRDRDADYQRIIDGCAALAESFANNPAVRADDAKVAEIDRWRARLDEVITIDYFDAPLRFDAEHGVAALTAPSTVRTHSSQPARRPVNAVWVTRKHVGVDRIASAWLIRRFIDSGARFRFVAPNGYKPLDGELRFDMFDAEFTHEGSQCTFETLLRRFSLDDPTLAILGEIVHDIDFKQHRFARGETAGVAAMIDGIAATVPDDDTRVLRGAELFDALYAALAAREPDTPGTTARTSAS